MNSYHHKKCCSGRWGRLIKAKISPVTIVNEIPWFVEQTYKNPDWQNITKVHDWRNYVGENTKPFWNTLPDSLKLAIALDAQQLADCEDWD